MQLSKLFYHTIEAPLLNDNAQTKLEVFSHLLIRIQFFVVGIFLEEAPHLVSQCYEVHLTYDNQVSRRRRQTS